MTAGWLLSAAGLLWLSGCSSGPELVTATGSVLENGKPVALGPTGVVQVTLVPDVAPGADFTSFLGRCNAAGEFEVVDVPQGKYKVCIEVLDPTPQDDKLQGAYSMENTKIIRDIDGKKPIVVDLARPDA